MFIATARPGRGTLDSWWADNLVTSITLPSCDIKEETSKGILDKPYFRNEHPKQTRTQHHESLIFLKGHASLSQSSSMKVFYSQRNGRQMGSDPP